MATLVAVLEVIGVRLVEVDGLLHQAQAEEARVERKVCLRVAGDGGHVMDARFNQFGDLERCSPRPGNVQSAPAWRDVLEPGVTRYRDRRLLSRGCRPRRTSMRSWKPRATSATEEAGLERSSGTDWVAGCCLTAGGQADTPSGPSDHGAAVLFARPEARLRSI